MVRTPPPICRGLPSLLDTGTILIITAVELTSSDVKILKTIINSAIIETVWLGEEITTDLIPDIHLVSEQDQSEQIHRIRTGIEEDGLLNGSYTNE